MNDKPDTRLTDYAVGELDEAARQAMQVELASDPAAQTEADEIARLGETMRKATVRPHASVEQRNALLQDIIAAHLASQKERVAAETAAKKVVLPAAASSRSEAWIMAGVAIAASILLIGVTTYIVLDTRYRSEMAWKLGPQPNGTASGPSTPVEEITTKLSVQIVPAPSLPKWEDASSDIVGLLSPNSIPSLNSGVSQPQLAVLPSNPPTSLQVNVGPASAYTVISGNFGTPPDLDSNGAVGLNSAGQPDYLSMGAELSPPGRFGEARLHPNFATPELASSPTKVGADGMLLDLGNGASSPLAFNRSDAQIYGGVISGTGGVQIVSGAITNAGTLQISNGNTYTGVTTVASGATLKINNNAASGYVFTGGTIVGAGSVIPQPEQVTQEKKVTSAAIDGSVAGPTIHAPVPASPLRENSRIAGGANLEPYTNAMYPLLLQHQQLLAAKVDPKDPRVVELDRKIKNLAETMEANGLGVAAAQLTRNPPPTEDSLIALLVERRRMAAMYGPSHPRTKELDAQYRNQQALYDEMRRAETVQHNTEAYDSIVENPFLRANDTPLSTFSIDVDTASYSNVRRFLNSAQLPPRGAVRVEEFLNYFHYSYPQPKANEPFSITTEAARCPWNSDHVLVRVGLKGREVHVKERPATNLVFLVDVSGSMQDQDKLPLVRESLKMLVRELGDNDRVAIVVYAGNSGLVLPSTGGNEKANILSAISKLEAGGSTNGGEGIQLAYQIAVENFIKGGVNRVVLATDGDFNVGITNQSDLVDLIEKKAKTGVFFSGLAYGTGNLKDSTLEKLADKGNGNYSYIDSLAEARKVLVEQMSATLVTIAKDVKVQIEFNPSRVEAYRLIGYENRVLAAQDFNDDKKDAGEIGAGHTMTALYEVVPFRTATINANVGLPPAIDPLKYQKPQPKPTLEPSEASKANELLTLKLRYKQPEGDVSKLIERPLKNDVKDYAKATADFKFAAAVASFGMLLRDSQHSGSATFDAVLELAQEGIGRDDGGYRREFIELVRKARDLKPMSTKPN